MMDVKPIKTETDYDSALAEIADLMEARPNTRAGDRLDVLVTLVEAYEERHWRVDPPDPIDAIRLRVEQRGLTSQDLQKLLGSKSRVSEIMNRKRPLTMAMIRRLHSGLGIPAESLLRPTTRATRRKQLRGRAA